MELIIEKVGEITILKIIGDIDTATAGLLKEKINFCAQQGNIRLVLDLGQVAFMNSTGLGSLVACHLTLQREGGIMKVCNLQPNIQRMFQLTRMNKALDVFSGVAEAVKSFEP